MPWLVWLSGLSTSLQTKGSLAGSVPSQGTCLGCSPGPQSGARGRQPHIDVSLPSSLKINIKIKIPALLEQTFKKNYYYYF